MTTTPPSRTFDDVIFAAMLLAGSLPVIDAAMQGGAWGAQAGFGAALVVTATLAFLDRTLRRRAPEADAETHRTPPEP